MEGLALLAGPRIPPCDRVAAMPKRKCKLLLADSIHRLLWWMMQPAMNASMSGAAPHNTLPSSKSTTEKRKSHLW